MVRMALRRLGYIGGLLAALAMPAGSALSAVDAEAPQVFSLQAEEPAAYGWQLGDLVERVLHVQVPPGWRLDERSLPRVDQRGGDVELRQMQITIEPDDATPDDDGQVRPTTWLDSLARLLTGRPGAAGGGSGEGRAGSGAATAADDKLLAAELGLGPAAARPTTARPAGPERRPIAGPEAADRRRDGPSGSGEGSEARSAGALAEAGAAWPEAVRSASRLRIRLTYQLFAGTRGPARLVELPGVTLLYEPVGSTATATGRTARELVLAGRPLRLAPLSVGAPEHQDGLGAWRPDAGVPRLSADEPATRLAWTLALAAVALSGAGATGLWLRRSAVAVAGRPFAQALAALAPGRRRQVSLTPEAAMRRLHLAFDQAAGRTLLAPDVPAWLADDGRYAAQAAEIQAFYADSGQLFFGAGAAAWPLPRIQALAQALARLELAAAAVASPVAQADEGLAGPSIGASPEARP